MKIIDLGSNKLTALPGDLFVASKEIESIGLAGNQITTLNETVFLGLKQLTSLYLGNNGLSLIGGYYIHVTYLIKIFKTIVNKNV